MYINKKSTYCKKKAFILRKQYSGAHISWHELFLAGNQGNHQNFDLSLLTYKWAKKFFFGIQNSKWPTQKTEFFNSVNSQYFFVKISRNLLLASIGYFEFRRSFTKYA